MRISRRAVARGLGVLASSAALSTLLTGCVLLPPSPDEVAGTYSADDAVVEMNADGTCRVVNFPDRIDADSEGEPVFGTERFDATCTWEIGDLMYSGTWDLNVEASTRYGDLDLEWLSTIGTTPCLARPLGDPDSGRMWQLCPTD